MQARADFADLSSQLQSQMQDMRHALSDFGQSIKAGIGSSMHFAKDVTRATYNVAGEHLLPIEDKIFQDVNGAQPPSLSQLNGFGIAVLAAPVMLPVFLSSITWIPLIGNSIPSGVKSFTEVVNMTLFDMANDKQLRYRTILGIDTANDNRNTLRNIYGLPGSVIGAVAGLPVAMIIGGARIISNNAKSFTQTWTALTNIALSESNQVSFIDIIKDNRHPVKKYFIGGIGTILGGIAGGISALAIALTRGAWHISLQSARSFKHAFANVANLAMAKEYEINIAKDERHWAKRFVAGGIGTLLGGIAGSIAALATALARGIWNVAYHSALSFKRTFAYRINQAVADGYEIDIANDNRHWAKGFILGGIGGLIGTVTGSIAAMATLLARGAWNIAYHSTLTLAHTFASIANKALPDNHQMPLVKDQPAGKRYGFGLIGAILGGVTGSIAALAIGLARGAWHISLQSARSFKHAFVNMVNLAVAKDYEIDMANDDRSLTQRFITGGIGTLLGGITGSIAALAIGLARGAWNVTYHSARSSKHAFVHAINQVVADGHEIDIADDNRHWAKRFVVGGIGGLIGAVTGSIAAMATLLARGIWNVAYHSTLSFAHTFARIANKALPDNHQMPLVKDQPFGKRYGFGLIGAILGGTTGLISAAAIGLARGVWHISLQSARSFKHAFINMVNLAVAKDWEIDMAKDERSLTKRFVTGGVGTLLGGIAGGISALAVALARGAWNLAYHSTLTFAHTFASLANKALPDNHQMPLVKDQPFGKRYGFGLIGAILGGAAGSISALAISMARGAWHISLQSARSFKHAFANMVNLAVAKDYEVDMAKDERSLTKRFVIGGIGTLLGGIAGGISALAVALARGAWNLVYHSTQTFKHAFAHAINQVVADGHEIKMADDDRHWAKRFILGGIGGIIGAVTGSIAATAALLARGIYNLAYHSTLTFAHTFASIANKALPDNHQMPLVKDQPFGKRYGFGLIGAILGGVTGLISAAAIGLARGLWHISLQSARSFKHAFANMVNLAVAKGWEIDMAKDERSLTQRFVTGGIGTLLGGIAGGISALAIALARGTWNLAYHSTLTFAHTFASIANVALPDNKKMPLVKDQPLGKRYGFGLIGAVLGGVAGSIAALIIGSSRIFWSFTRNTAQSWRALSGSLINGAVYRPWFQGLGGDDRSTSDKCIGGFGYLLAAVTTAPIAGFIFLAKQAPLLGVGLVMVAVSPLVMLCKGIARSLEACCGVGARFNANDDPNDAIMQKFKNLYSSLTASGNLTENSQIASHGSGKESLPLFFAKSFKLNLRSGTESLLDALLKAYRQSNDANFFSPGNFDNTVQAVKDRYSVGCLDSVESVDKQHEKIDKLADFIQDYMRDQTEFVPGNINTPSIKPNWKATFWGSKDNRSSKKAPESKTLTV